MKTIIVTGVKGQLGYDCVRQLKERGLNPIGTDKEEFDITDINAVSSFFEKTKPDALIHCAAYTAVDKAESDRDIAYKVNVEGTKNLALTCKRYDIPMMYFSTDYVFDGMGDSPYKVDTKTAPINYYGETKLGGEIEVINNLSKYFILRISWVFGINGKNFIKTMIDLGKTHKELTVVCDQIGSPTYTYDLSKLICDMIGTEKYGIYHATNEGFCSWADFAKEIFVCSGQDVKVMPVLTKDYKASVAKRPLNSRLDKSMLDDAGFKHLPSWQDATKRYIEELKKENYF